MSESRTTQAKLRDEITEQIIGALQSGLDPVEAAIATMGAACVVLGLLPPKERKEVINIICLSLHSNADKRAAEIRA